MFPELQEFVMSLKQCSLIRGVAIVKALMSLARAELQIRIFPVEVSNRTYFFVFRNNNITFLAARLEYDSFC